MGKNTSFTLSDHLASFVEGKVAEGRYASASDVVRAGLRLLEEQEAKLDALRAALSKAKPAAKPRPLISRPSWPQRGQGAPAP